MNPALNKWKRRIQRRVRLPRRKISFGDLGRMRPLCPDYGFTRGQPIDRFYIEQFMESHRPHVQGRVLELLNSNYTQKYGGEKVTQSEVLDINPANRKATLYDDLRTLSSISDNSYDCVILTQTLHLIDDDRAALRQAYRILAPGGALLMTVPCISKVPSDPVEGIWCRFYTDPGVTFMLSRDFQRSAFSVSSYGNLPLSTAFLYGLSVQDLDRSLFRANDPEYPVIVGACATKTTRPNAAA